MQKILECIPNFSEGRNQKTIDEILKSIRKIPQVKVLNYTSDIDHNRSVITFAGEPNAVTEAAFQGCKKAAELIDLDKHKGVHPRMGATDVIPFVPIKGIRQKEAIKLARNLAERIATELQIPIYLYEKCATRPERKNLANVRNIGYEKIKAEIGKNPDRDPDFGPKKLGKAGATAVGVRFPLIALNVNLNTNDLKIAQLIAKKIREKDGGLPKVKALAFELKHLGIVQVSMNLVDYRVTSPYKAFIAIKKEAAKHDVEILESELIGLIPTKALPKNPEKSLKLKISKNQILENTIANNPTF